MKIIINEEQFKTLTKLIIEPTKQQVNEFGISKINDFYDSQSESFDDKKYQHISNKNKRAQEVAWSDYESQKKRFDVLFDVGVKDGDTVLDFGCGLGAMYEYIQKRDLQINYIGVDINKDFIDDNRSYFKKELNNEKKSIKFQHISTIDDVVNNFDWFIASGVFTIEFSIKDVLEIITKAYDKSKKGLSFNFIGEDDVKKTKDYDGFIVYNPEFIKSELEKHFGKVELIKNYLEVSDKLDDFTIHIKKAR